MFNFVCIFRVFDRQSKGYIDAGDLKATMTQLGVELTSHDVEAMMHDAGVKADGRIFYEGTSYGHLQWVEYRAVVIKCTSKM